MIQASKLFEGYHDFRTFMGKNKNEDRITRKHIQSISIVKQKICGYSEYSWPTIINEKNDNYLQLDVYIKGSSFVYRQVGKLGIPTFFHNVSNKTKTFLQQKISFSI